MNLVVTIIFAIACFAVGLFFILRGIRSRKREKIYGPITSVLGIFVFTIGILTIVNYPEAEHNIQNYQEQCEAAGGTVLPIDGPNQCWKERIMIEGK